MMLCYPIFLTEILRHTKGIMVSCFCFAADSQMDISIKHAAKKTDYRVALNRIPGECKRVIMLGHNSMVEEIMNCYEAYIACQTGDPQQIGRAHV